MNAKRYDVIVIGAGMGGLSCGTLLAKEGLRVLICEQSSKPGGYCVNFRRNGFTFAPAVHYLNEFGPNSQMKEAFQTLDDSPFHFIGSLVPSQHHDLLRIPLEGFQPLPGQRLASCLAYRTTKKVFGQERTIVITYNENLLEGQLQGIEASLTKARHKLD